MSDMVKAAFANKQRFPTSPEDLKIVDEVLKLLGINATWDGAAECYKLENEDQLVQTVRCNTYVTNGESK